MGQHFCLEYLLMWFPTYVCLHLASTPERGVVGGLPGGDEITPL